MNYYTVKEIERMVYPVRIHRVWQEGKYTVIELEGGLIANPQTTVVNRHNDAIKGASVRPRIKIRNF